MRKELIEDDRIPSAVQIENKIILKRKIDYFRETIENLEDIQSSFKELSQAWELILNSESLIPKGRNLFSNEDRYKINYFEQEFKRLLTVFNYQSKSTKQIKISDITYLPEAQKDLDLDTFYKIKFDSSASDFIRCLWSYYTALMETSIKYNGNHPKLLIFDEPKQQDRSMADFKSFLSKLSTFHKEQVIIFASFENSIDSFNEATGGLAFNLIEIKDKLIIPLDQ